MSDVEDMLTFFSQSSQLTTLKLPLNGQQLQTFTYKMNG
jgi:hypothetical protein